MENLKQQNCIYVSNHYEGVDFSIIMQQLSFPGFNATYTISKSDLALPHKFGVVADALNNTFMNSLNLIPYKRGNKESGINVLQQVEEKFNNNKHINLLVFPEGESRKYGIPSSFKPGIFKFAEQHNIPIIPITIYYKPFIGSNRGDARNLSLWLNNDVQVFIHEKISPQDYKIMLEQSFNTISSTRSKMDEMS
jgi:1-acyl-sn-glycerol-3-phosphate acyltransferase